MNPITARNCVNSSVLKCHQGVPKKILRRRRKTANRRAFQVWMKLIDNDDLRSLSALLDDPQRVATVEQHGGDNRDVEFCERWRQVVNVAII
jgi:hypothetical protein